MKAHRSIRPRKALTVLAVSVAFGATLTGCSSDDSVTIGVAAPLSGEAAIFGGAVDKITRAVVNRVNELGGIDGTKLKVVSEDEKFNAEDGVRVINKLINNDDAQFIIGPSSSSFMASLELAERSEVAIASPYSGIVELDDRSNPYTFRTVGPDTFDGLTVAQNLWDQGYRRLGILYENSDTAKSTSTQAEEFFTKLGGEVVEKVAFNGGQSSYQTEVDAAFSADPDVVFLAGSAESAVPILRQWARTGAKGNWSFISELTYQGLLDEVGPQYLEGSFGQSPISSDSPAAKGMLDLLIDEYGQEDGKDWAERPGAANSYDAIVVAMLAMAAGGDASGKAVADNLHKVTDPGGTPVSTLDDGLKALEKGDTIDYQGASGPVDFTDTNTAASDYGVYQVVDGKFEVSERYEGAQLFELLGKLGEES